MDIYLNKEIIENLDLTNYDIAVYVALRSMYVSTKEEFYISVRMIAYELFGCKIPQRGINHIKESISHLAEYGLFEIVSSLSGSEFIINGKNLHLETYNNRTKEGSFFTVVDSDEVKQIMSMDIGKAKYPLLRFFLNVLGTFNRSQGVYDGLGTAIQNFVGYMGQDYIGGLSGINRCVVEDYFEILEEAKILYVYRHDKVQRQDGGQIKSLTNHYGRYADRASILDFALQYEDSLFGTSPADRANEKRSMMAKYGFILKDPEKYLPKYSDAELIEIYQYVCDRHKSQKALGLDDIKDLSVFDDVPCIVEYLSKKSKPKKKKVVVSIRKPVQDKEQWGEPDVMDKEYSVEEILEVFDEDTETCDEDVSGGDCGGEIYKTDGYNDADDSDEEDETDVYVSEDDWYKEVLGF